MEHRAWEVPRLGRQHGAGPGRAWANGPAVLALADARRLIGVGHGAAQQLDQLKLHDGDRQCGIERVRQRASLHARLSANTAARARAACGGNKNRPDIASGF
jgi:hypothetical protein